MPPQAGGDLSTVLGYAGKAGKKAAEMGRFFASEWLREPGAQKMLIGKAEPFLRKGIDQLSTAIRPKKAYKTNRKDLDKWYPSQSGGLINPFDLAYGFNYAPWTRPKTGGARARRRGPTAVDKAAYIMSNFLTPAPGFATAAKVLAGQAFKGVKDNVDYYRGSGVDIHKAIGKLPKPKGGFTLPGHNYTGPYNPLEQQLRYDPTTGEILEFYVNPTGKTDAIAAQHDVDYSVCGNDRRCKNKADRKMVKSLDAIPWKERQWGHALARNVIDVKQKLGLGVSGARGASRPKNGKRF